MAEVCALLTVSLVVVIEVIVVEEARLMVFYIFAVTDHMKREKPTARQSIS